MRTRCHLVLPLLALIGSALLGDAARAGVRVDMDEVIFSLRAPESAEVYLVGDFNQWNPTVERMNRVEDRFEVGLFLVAGTYRYKFVVDGKTIPDPENPGPTPERGSPLMLVERSGGLILSTELPDETGGVARANFGVRYIGRFTGEDGDADGVQRVDGFVSATFDKLRAHAVAATHDSSWTWSPARVDAYFDRGAVEAQLGKLTLTGFENDSTWVSSDPMGLVGDAGVFGYDAGFRRHGAAAVLASSKLALRGLYADETSRHPGGAAVTPDLGPFASGASADTSVYAYQPSFDGSDVAALELTASLGGGQLGYTWRNERGVNPGAFTDAQRAGTGIRTETWSTREERRASALWLAYPVTRQLRVTGAYGWGGADARVFAVTTPSQTTPAEASRAIGETTRGIARLETTRDGANVSAQWDYTRFDFDAIAAGSRAEVNRATLHAGTTWRGWDISGDGEYTRARYGTTPGALNVDWPEQNVWLSLWDAFSVPRLAAADLNTFTVFSLSAAQDGDRIDAGIDAVAVAEDIAGRLRHAGGRARIEWAIAGPWRAGADARLVWYDGGDRFAAGYVEAGYRTRRLEANAGFGFDPLVFDPVINDFADTGRERYLRGVLDDGFARERAGEITAALREHERALQDVTVIKVEIIVRLP
ncbi:MAG TPA: glycogen-binding domain-containing protein [Candidatus Krumholzibacteria bacterium]|nr:glycogen-binding domain-containing protein [Candidatus Krumholzibacteria bacterium]